MVVTTMMNRINIIDGFGRLRSRAVEVSETFPALKYLSTLVFTILTIFSVSNPWLTSALLFLLALIISRSKPLLVFMVVISVYLWDLKSDIDQIRSTNYSEQTQEITIRLTDLKIVDPKLLSKSSVSYQAQVVSSKIDFPQEVMVNFFKPPVLARGDVLRVKGKLVTRSVKIPDSFDYFDYLAKKKIGGIFYVKKVISHTSQFNWFSGIEFLRDYVLRKVTKGYDYGSIQWRIVTGAVMGEKRNLTYDDRQRFVISGIFHIFAVSGMHVALVALLLFYFLGLIRISYRLKLLISPLLLLIYVLMTGASSSSLRAFGMVAIWWVGQFLFRTSNLYYLLALCALFQLLFSPLLLYNAGFQFSFLIVFFLLRGMEIKKGVKAFFWVKENLSVKRASTFTKRVAFIGFDLLYLGILIFLAAFGLQIHYFKIIQPLTIFTAVWSGFCASGIILFSILKIIFPFEFINTAIDFFIIPLNSFAEFVFNRGYYSYVNPTSLYFVLMFYLFLILALFIRRIWLLLILVMITWVVVALQTSSIPEIYYANVKGSHIVACVNLKTRSAVVYLNGRSTQSAISKLLAAKRVETITELWIGKGYTPTWQLGKRFTVKSKQLLSALKSPMPYFYFEQKLDQSKLSVKVPGFQKRELSLDDVEPNEFHLIHL